MRYVIALLVWLTLAIAAGAAGLTQRLPFPAPQLLLFGLTFALLAASRWQRGFRNWLLVLGWRPLVALHLVRFVGIYFLFLHAAGELPFEFAVPGGIGDILVAVLALLLLFTRHTVDRRPSILIAWNVFGLVDILLVVATAARLGMTEPASMAALLRLPLSLLPTFVVPLIIASHVWIFFRYGPRFTRTKRAAPA